MAEKKTTPKAVASWRLDPDIIALLQAIAEKEGESQAAVLRALIKKEAKRLDISHPKKD